jgi:flavin reductase (DIM6/NTAB) family NADH-FMN oxidoreductase RutF
MDKIRVKPYPFLYPKPVIIIGALVEGKPNFFTVADITSIGYKPPRIIVISAKVHYTNQSIMEN